MKKFLKINLSFVLALTLILSSAYIGLNEINMSSLFSIKTSAASIENLTLTLNDDEASYSVTDCDETAEGELIIPDTYNGLPVTDIGLYAFSDCVSLTSVIIPNTVTTIKNGAFNKCSSLLTITIGSGVTSIGYGAFRECTGLTSVIIPNTVTEMTGATFADCTGLTHVELSNRLTTIKDYTFSHCSSLTSIEIPLGVKTIEEYAFSSCTDLVSVIIPETLKTIEKHAFNFCKKLPEITLPNGLTEIGEYAFRGCSLLNKITIPDSVETIGDCAFYDTKYYDASANWIDGVLYINNHLIKADTNIAGLYEIKESTRVISDRAFYNCDGLTGVVMPNSVTHINYAAFYNCYNLETITLSDSITNIANYAFCRCYKLEAITLPSTLTKINEGVFFSCTSLKSITIPSDIIAINAQAFSGTESLVEVITPCNSCASTYFDASVLNPIHGTISDWIVDQTATCSKPELRHKECTVCFTVLESYIAPATREHISSDWIIDADSTCADTGSKHKECTECGEELDAAEIPATGEHTQSDWIIDANATVSAPGSKHKECTVCGETLEIAAIAQLKPATPKAATTNEIGGVKITWNAVDGAVKYQVYRRQGGQTAWTLVGTTTGTSLTDAKVSSGIYYVYSVRAYNNAGQYSDFVSANTQTRKYMAVPKLKGISNATNGLYITWNPVAGVTNGYRVYRRGAGSTYWTYLGTTKNTYYTDTAVKNKSGEYFRYTVIADGGYHSKFDTTGLFLRRLSNPTLKSATSAKAGITVKWNAVNGSLGYYVYRKTANSGWTRIAVVNGANASSYLDKTAKKGVTYTYTVRAVCGNVTSYFNSGISCKDKY